MMRLVLIIIFMMESSFPIFSQGKFKLDRENEFYKNLEIDDLFSSDNYNVDTLYNTFFLSFVSGEQISQEIIRGFLVSLDEINSIIFVTPDKKIECLFYHTEIPFVKIDKSVFIGIPGFQNYGFVEIEGILLGVSGEWKRSWRFIGWRWGWGKYKFKTRSKNIELIGVRWVEDAS